MKNKMPTPTRRIRTGPRWPVDEDVVVNNLLAAQAEAAERQRIEDAELNKAALERIKQQDWERRIMQRVEDIRLGITL